MRDAVRAAVIHLGELVEMEDGGMTERTHMRDPMPVPLPDYLAYHCGTCTLLRPRAWWEGYEAGLIDGASDVAKGGDLPGRPRRSRASPARLELERTLDKRLAV